MEAERERTHGDFLGTFIGPLFRRHDLLDLRGFSLSRLRTEGNGVFQTEVVSSREKACFSAEKTSRKLNSVENLPELDSFCSLQARPVGGSLLL